VQSQVGTQVYVVNKDNKVEVEKAYKQQWIIKKGLKKGERVIYDSVQKGRNRGQRAIFSNIGLS